MWKQKNQFSVCTYEFSNFFKAVTFIDKIGLICDKIQHQPNWKESIHNVRVEIYIDKEGRPESLQELQEWIDEIYFGVRITND